MKFVLPNNNGLVCQYVATFTATLNLISCGMFFAWPSPSLPKLLQEDFYITITQDEGSWLAVIFLLSAILGALLDGYILDKFGRKNVILVSSVPFFISWIMVAYVETVELLLLARFVAGLANGLVFPAVCIYLAEISDPSIRGFSGSIITVAHIFGMLLINIIGSYLTIKTAALVSSMVPLLVLLTFSWIPESPYYFIMKGNLEQARRSLKVFKGREDVEEELSRLSKAIEEQTSNTGRYLDLFSVKSNRKALLMLVGLRAAEHFCGANAFIFYAQIIFKETGDGISPTLHSIIYFSMQLLASTIASFIVDKTGRRPLMIVSLSGATVALLVESCYFYLKNVTDTETDSFTIISIIALIGFVVMYSMGMLTIPFVIVGEIFPANVKAFAVSFMDVYFCVVTTVVSKFFQATKDEFGLHVPFIVFTVCGLLGVIFIIFCVPETKGKTLEEIQAEQNCTKKGSQSSNNIMQILNST